MSPLHDAEGVVEHLDHGTKQLVVHEALETTTCVVGVEVVVVDARSTKVASASVDGAEMMTRLAPALEVGRGRLLAAGEEPGRLDHHLDPELVPGQRLGSRSARTRMRLLADHEVGRPRPATGTAKRPWVES